MEQKLKKPIGDLTSSIEPRLKDLQELKTFINNTKLIVGEVLYEDIVDWINKKIEILKYVKKKQYKDFIKDSKIGE